MCKENQYNSSDLTSLPATTSLCANSDAKYAAWRASAFLSVTLLSYNDTTEYYRNNQFIYCDATRNWKLRQT